MIGHKEKELAKLFFRELEKIQKNEILNFIDKIDGLYFLMNRLFLEITREEKLQFTTFFARLVFVFQKWNIEKKIQFWVHSFRRERWNLANNPDEKNAQEVYELGMKAVAESIKSVLGTEIPAIVLNNIPPKSRFVYTKIKVKEFRRKVRVVLMGEDEEKAQFIGRDEENPTETIHIQYNIADLNENFNASVRVIRYIFKFPVSVNLVDVAIDEHGVYRPRAFVINPDYLVDVSAISECFKEFGAEPMLYLLKKFLPFETTKPLMIGNIANFFLDELMTNPEAHFKDIFPKVFRLNPLAFIQFENSEVREIMQKSQKHFLNLKRYVTTEFEKFDIQPQDCFLEPSFYAEKYGLQGRLDAFLKNKDKSKSAIIELKSGKAYMPNRYGISNNHFTQTLLYDMIIRAVFGEKIEPVNYIFYSGLDDRQLRYAPVVKAQQYEALQLRNQILALERSLENIDNPEANKGELANPLFKLNPNRFPQIRGFLNRDLGKFSKVYGNLDELERTYFNAFTGFIAREHRLAKTGIEGAEKRNGLSALWQDSFFDKERNFNIISFLEIEENKVREEEPILVFKKTEKTNPLANFRNGDIAVLYPYQKEKTSVLTNQIFKCSITEITKEKVVVRLRSKQFNNSLFEKFPLWNLEHDLMDSSFNAMYRGLFSFAGSKKAKRNLLLTISPSKKPNNNSIPKQEGLTTEQQNILEKAINAKDYFLLWGPPGTGKTSKMIRHLTKWVLEETDQNLLLLAYTNRAVDEICEAVESIHSKIRKDYLRIGSKFSTSTRFRSQLLSEKSTEIATRKDLRALIDSRRIFISTVASFSSKMDLLKLKKFDQVIIDEASQILEPVLVGLLPHFNKFILVGDHKQLPAVVVQDEGQSAVVQESLHEIGLNNLKNSFFERLYKRCESQDWNWAYAKLSHQGRMHQEIMQFPNEEFYAGFLNVLPDEIPHATTQRAELKYLSQKIKTSVEVSAILRKRTLFFDTPIDESSSTQKTNRHEAELIGTLLEHFHDLYLKEGKKLTTKCIGIITPFRAQIAQIQDVIQSKEINLDFVTIDTVERYQGGARDIILISLCTNSSRNLDSLISLSEEGVDRKLNVALTRAREQVILIGNEKILSKNTIYRKLIEAFKE